MSGSEEKEVSILKRKISDLQKTVENLENENKRLKKENQSMDIIKCMEQIQDDLRLRYVKLDELVHNPGLEHIALQVFKYLDPKSLAQCRAVSKGWKLCIDNHENWFINYELDELVHNPRFEHIALQIFKHLDPKSLCQCRAVSKGWKLLIDNHEYSSFSHYWFIRLVTLRSQ